MLNIFSSKAGACSPTRWPTCRRTSRAAAHCTIASSAGWPEGSRFPAVVSVTALRDADNVIIGYLLIGTDNTARKQVEAEQKKLDQRLRDQQFYTRSPLNAILGFAQLMESASPLPTPAQKASIDQILQAGWHLLELINEILDLALIESGKLSMSLAPIALAEVLNHCKAMVEPQSLRGEIRLSFPQADRSLAVSADRTRLKQVLINLLSNAIKYNRPGGLVEVTCSATTATRTRISCRDTGGGLSLEQLAQLFQPFNRLGQEDGATEGTGIGLVVSKRLVELMGGEIAAESSVGVGSVFWIELNSTAPPPARSGFCRSCAGRRHAGSERRTGTHSAVRRG